MRLDGTVSVVTGGGRGIGREIALQQAREGAAVAVLARSGREIEAVADEIIKAGGRAVATPVDLLDAGAVAAAIARLRESVGPIDLLINNAGRFEGFGPLWAVDPEDWWRDIEVNLRGTFHCCRAVIDAMRERGRGRIINLVGGGTALSFPNGSGYGTSKAGLLRLTECMDDELDGSGVLVFAMDPGLVRTAMTELQLQTEAGKRWLPGIQTMFRDGVNISPTRAAALAADIAAGRFDDLHGRMLMAIDDRDALERDAGAIVAADGRVLRVSAMGT